MYTHATTYTHTHAYTLVLTPARTPAPPHVRVVFLNVPLNRSFCLQLYVFLPRKIEGIGKLERKISRDLIEGAISKMTYQHVDVYLPKFRYELGLPYKDMMTRVGIKHLFEYGRTNLAGIGML